MEIVSFITILLCVAFDVKSLGLMIFAASYLDFWDAGHVKWVECSSTDKFEKLMDLYGDDTFIKLLKKVKPYEF